MTQITLNNRTFEVHKIEQVSFKDDKALVMDEQNKNYLFEKIGEGEIPTNGYLVFNEEGKIQLFSAKQFEFIFGKVEA